MKRGQVTLFIIIGVLILIIFGLIAYLNATDSKETVDDFTKKVEVPAEVKPVHTFYETCVEEIAKEGILEISLKAGYYQLPLLVFNSEYGDVPYFYYSGESLFAGKDNFEEQLSMYINDNLGLCIGNFSAVKGFNISMDSVNSKVNVIGEKIVVNFEQSAKVNVEGSRYSLEFPSYEFDARMKDIYTTSKRLVDGTVKAPKKVNMSLIFKLMEEYNLRIDTMSNEDDKVVYVIQDPDNKIDDIPHMFLFAVKTFDENLPPKIVTEKIQGVEGEEITGYIEAEDEDMDDLTFFADSLFITDRYSGGYNFTAPAGVYDVNVTVSDGKHTVTKMIRVEVNES